MLQIWKLSASFFCEFPYRLSWKEMLCKSLCDLLPLDIYSHDCSLLRGWKEVFLPTTGFCQQNFFFKKVFGRNFFAIFRSSSLIVPPPTPQSSSWGSPRSPGSRSLHLSPYHRSKESSPLKTGNIGSAAISTGPEMFTFPSVSDQAMIDLKLNLHLFL